MICEHQLQFTRHCLRMPKDEPANIYIICQNKIRWSNHHKNPGLTYLDQISKYLSTDNTVRFSAEEMANYDKNKQLWNLSIAVHKWPARPPPARTVTRPPACLPAHTPAHPPAHLPTSPPTHTPARPPARPRV